VTVDVREMSAARDVVVAGIGVIPAGEHWSESLRGLALRAIRAAQAEAPALQPQALYVANMLAPSLSGQTHLGALLADFAGFRGIEAYTVEAGGASGGAALRQGYLAVVSGLVDVALVVGVEKMTDKVGPAVETAVSSNVDADHEAVQGVTPTAQAAMIMRRYLLETGAPPDALAGFSLVAHKNAVASPHAFYRREIRLEDYRRAPMVSEPLNLLDAAPLVDGAAAVILARAECLPSKEAYPRISMAGSSVSNSVVALHDQPDMLALPAAAESAARAMAQAAVGVEDLDLFELHDQYTIQAALVLEAAGFAERGKGWELARDGATAIDGRIPISTFGGSKARGDTGGATGVYQVAEVVLQLQGRAAENQISGARVGMAQCLGGAGATAATHVMVRANRP
jgi:acetyl-CoA C-acetyltransferase